MLFTTVKPDDRPMDELRTTVERLQERATGAYEFDLVARYHERFGTHEDALQFALKALQADPTCQRWLNTYANVLYAQGHTREAIAAKRHAIDLAPDSMSMRPFEEELRCLEKPAVTASCLRK